MGEEKKKEKKSIVVILASLTVILIIICVIILPLKDKIKESTNNSENDEVEVDNIAEEPIFKLSEYPRVDGSSATAPLTEAFKRNFTGVDNVEITNSKTHQAYVNLIDGECDLILATEPSEEEINYAKDKNVELNYEKIANEGFVFFVNATNPVDSLTIEQLQKIYSGEITNWVQVGGNSEKIVAYQKPEYTSTQAAMKSLVMNGEELKSPEKQNIAEKVNDIVDVVADYKNGKGAIGYTYFYYANIMYLNSQVKLLKINDVSPSKTTIKSGNYPLTTSYYIVTRADAKKNSPEIKLRDAMLSERGQRIVENVLNSSKDNSKTSDEKVINLDETFDLNDLRIFKDIDYFDSVKYEYCEIDGLTNLDTQDSINQHLKEDIKEEVRKLLEENPDINREDVYCSSYVISNFANTLSIYYSISANIYDEEKSEEKKINEYVTENFDLVTGKKIKVNDIFAENMIASEIFSNNFYTQMISKYTEQYMDESNYNIYVSDYRDIEEEIARLIQLFYARKDIKFTFDEQGVNFLDYGVEIYYDNYLDKVVIYDKYKTKDSIFDGQYKNLKELPVLTKRQQAEYQIIEEGQNYYIDISLFDLRDAGYRNEATVEVVENFMKNTVERLKEKASKGPSKYFIENYAYNLNSAMSENEDTGNIEKDYETNEITITKLEAITTEALFDDNQIRDRIQKAFITRSIDGKTSDYCRNNLFMYNIGFDEYEVNSEKMVIDKNGNVLITENTEKEESEDEEITNKNEVNDANTINE